MQRTKVQRLTELILTVFRLNGALVVWGDDFSVPEGLTSARWQMLGALALAGQPQTAPQIAASMGVTRQGAQKQLNLLAQSGLIKTRDNPRHKRSPMFVLTQQGRRIYAEVDRRWNRHATQVASAFSSADLDTAEKVLSTLSAVYVGSERRHEA